jgi:hypothetical protein
MPYLFIFIRFFLIVGFDPFCILEFIDVRLVVKYFLVDNFAYGRSSDKISPLSCCVESHFKENFATLLPTSIA